jgi:SAM-dependent methyltransferase
LFFVRTDASVHHRLPFEDASFGLVLSVFAPRPIDEIQRVLRADGFWLIVDGNPGPPKGTPGIPSPCFNWNRKIGCAHKPFILDPEKRHVQL